MSHLSPDVLLTAGTTVILAGTAALWKLASSLTEVRTIVKTELNHNGGGSIKDQVKYLKDTLDSAVSQSRADVERVEGQVDRNTTDLHEHISRVRRQEGQEDQALRQLQHDVSGLRAQIALLASLFTKKED